MLRETRDNSFSGLTIKQAICRIMEALIHRKPELDITVIALAHAMHPEDFKETFKCFMAIKPDEMPHEVFMRIARSLCMAYPPSERGMGFELEEFEWNFVNHILSLSRRYYYQ